MWGKPVIPRRSLNFHLSSLGRLCEGVWYLRKDSCGLLSALEFSMVALELPLIGLMDFQGRQTGALLIWCQDWTLCGLLGDQPCQVGVRGWFREAVTAQSFQARWPGNSSLSLPNLLSWSSGKLQASLREKGVAFQATISDISELQGELPLCRTRMPHVQSGGVDLPNVVDLPSVKT